MLAIPPRLITITYAFGAIACAVVVGAVLMALAGHDPIMAYRSLILGGFGSAANAGATLNLAAPLMTSGVGAAIAFRAGVFNIGQEGQIALGGAAASLVALKLLGFSALSPFWAIIAAISAGAAAGLLWATLTTIGRLAFGANEIIVSLLFAIVGVLVTNYLVSGPLFLEGSGFPQSPGLPTNVWLPIISYGAELHIGIVIAVAAAVIGWFFLSYTRRGFELRTLGASIDAARYARLPIARLVSLAMAVSGGLAGIAGVIEILGSQHRLILGYSAGFGFTSLSAALLANLNPLGCIVTAIFFAFLAVGGLQMEQEAGVSAALASVIQGLTILFLISGLAVGELRRRRRRPPAGADVAAP